MKTLMLGTVIVLSLCWTGPAPAHEGAASAEPEIRAQGRKALLAIRASQRNLGLLAHRQALASAGERVRARLAAPSPDAPAERAGCGIPKLASRGGNSRRPLPGRSGPGEPGVDRRPGQPSRLRAPVALY